MHGAQHGGVLGLLPTPYYAIQGEEAALGLIQT